jgi:mRNA-degrading endonuclease RelE of RelBE toxin-antitoxin system
MVQRMLTQGDIERCRYQLKNMTYTIKIKEPAARWLRKYDKEIQKRFAVKIRKLKENPDLRGKPLRGRLLGIIFRKKI